MNATLPSPRQVSPKSLVALCIIAFSCQSLLADEPQVDEITKLTEAQPGQVALVSRDKMNYFLRLPQGYDAAKGSRLIVFLHGSNMNGLQYLRTMEARGWCQDDILVCPNGERGTDPFGRNNFSFVSARYIAEVTKEVQAAWKISHSYIGGHSQGGFVTYSAIMHYPELFDGAFPMAGDCWLQNEPNLWEAKPEVVAKQKKIAIAVIHGQADPVVRFSQGRHAHGVFLAMGYPKLRLFAPEKLGHQFALSPVPEALAWLDAVTGRNPTASLKLAEEWLENGEWGHAHQAALAVSQADADNAETVKTILAAVEKQAAEAAVTMKQALATEPAREWLPEWYEFRQLFGSTEAARPLIKNYEAARETERSKGLELFRKAISLGRQKKMDERNATLEQILEEAPHTYHAWYAIDWLKPKG